MLFAYLIDFDDNEHSVVFEIDFVARPDDRCDLLDNAVPSQDIVITQSWSDGKLFHLD